MSNREIEYRYRSELIHDILTKNYHSLEEIQSRAALYGWMFKRGMRVIVYDIDDFKMRYLEKTTGSRPLEWIHEPMTQIIKTHLSTVFQCCYIQYSDTIVFLIEYASGDERTTKASLVQMNDEINSEIEAETGYTTTIGVGDYKSGVEGAANSYAEAGLAVKIGHMLGKRNATIFYNDLGIYKFLSNIYEIAEGQDFMDETLRPLIEYDEQHHTEFYQTLVKVVEMDWNLQRTSEALHIHYNTVKYRVRRAEEILNLDFSVYENKLKIALAICWKNIAS